MKKLKFKNLHTYSGDTYYIDFVGVFYGGEFECIESALYVCRKTGESIDISSFLYDFLPPSLINEIETSIINS